MGNMARQRWLVMSALGIGAFASTACNMKVLDGLNGGSSPDAGSAVDAEDDASTTASDDASAMAPDAGGDGDTPPEESSEF